MSNVYDSILLTGGHGMLAHAVKRQLTRRDLTAVAVDREHCDIADPACVERTFDDVRPTLVVNCAAYTAVDKAEQEPDLADRVNGHGVAVLADAARRHGARLVHYSTDFVFDGTATEPYRPDAPTNPISAYGRSKLLGERAAAERHPDGHLVIRTAWLYGPCGNCFPKTMVALARQGKPLKVVADQTGSPTYTLDLAEATLGLLDAGATGTLHVTNGGRTTWHDFTAAILDEFRCPTELSSTTAAEWATARPQAARRPAFSVLDVTATECALGRPMRPWREALADYHALTAGAP